MHFSKLSSDFVYKLFNISYINLYNISYTLLDKLKVLYTALTFLILLASVVPVTYFVTASGQFLSFVVISYFT